MIDKIKNKIIKLSAKIINFAKDFFRMDNIVLIAMVGLALIFSLSSISVLNKNYSLQQQVDQAKLDNEIIKLQNQNLRLQQMYYQTDEFLELQARALLGKSNSGENLVLLPQSEELSIKPSSLANGLPGAEQTDESNLNQWTEFLFGEK